MVRCRLWEGQFELDEDMMALQRGSNLMYLSAGNFDHNVAVAQELMASFPKSTPECIDICKENDITSLLFELQANRRAVDKVLVVYGVESVSSNERRVLDFAYRLTDSSSELSNIVLLFVVESGDMELGGSLPQILPPTQQLELKLALADALNEDSVFFNGHAFTGRLARTSFQPSLTDIKISAQGCHSRRSEAAQKSICDFLSSDERSTDETKALKDTDNHAVGFADSDSCPPNKALKVVFTGVFLAFLYIAVYTWCKRSPSSTSSTSSYSSGESAGRSTTTASGSSSVSAQVFGQNTFAREDLYGGHTGSAATGTTAATTSTMPTTMPPPPPSSAIPEYEEYVVPENVRNSAEREPRVRSIRSSKRITSLTRKLAAESDPTPTTQDKDSQNAPHGRNLPPERYSTRNSRELRSRNKLL